MVAEDRHANNDETYLYISDTNERTSSISDKMVAQDAATSVNEVEIYISDTNERTS
jgi:hypothetical protein